MTGFSIFLIGMILLFIAVSIEQEIKQRKKNKKNKSDTKYNNYIKLESPDKYNEYIRTMMYNDRITLLTRENYDKINKLFENDEEKLKVLVFNGYYYTAHEHSYTKSEHNSKNLEIIAHLRDIIHQKEKYNSETIEYTLSALCNYRLNVIEDLDELIKFAEMYKEYNDKGNYYASMYYIRKNEREKAFQEALKKYNNISCLYLLRSTLTDEFTKYIIRSIDNAQQGFESI